MEVQTGHLACNTVHWDALVSMAMNLWVPKVGNFLAS